MSQVVPFRALRPQKAFASQVAARPYDVLDVTEARQVVRDNPLSFLHVEKSEIDVPDAAGVEDLRIYERARDNLRKLRDEGVLAQDPAPVFYLYCQRMAGRTQTGIVACVSVAEYRAGQIRRHEWTRADKERERTLHVDTVGAQTGPVFLTYHGQAKIDRLMAEVMDQCPEYDFLASDGVAHTVWVIADPAVIREVEAGFAAVEALYIADGHHRAAAATTVAALRDARLGEGRAEQGWMLAVLFPHNQLRVMDYNRAVRDLNGLSPSAFLERVRAEGFLISEPFSEKSPGQACEFGMYLGGRWYRLTARPEIRRDDDAVAGLDVSLLQEALLAPILGIGDPRTDSRISFIGGIRGMAELERLVDSDGYAVAFSLYPPTIEQMMAVADTGRVMPPKSTWFEPKLLSGLFVHLLE
ncbi:MAG: DUF1015 family protein [Syntrophaceae bacterium]|nr:DUF1015 family protein [Syntrophaceae bacterium]